MIDLEPNIVDCESASPLENSAAQINFNDVHFGYPNGPKVLNGISFTLNTNQTIVIVGLTGAGKSTIIKMLLRYYEPNSGIVNMNGTDVQKITLHSMRQQIGYVSQEIYLFHGTVRENIASN